MMKPKDNEGFIANTPNQVNVEILKITIVGVILKGKFLIVVSE